MCSEEEAVTAEPFLIRTVGGPHPGDRTAPPHWPWPLPDRLPDTGGHYHKVGESQLPPIKGVIRGAEYRWHEANGAC